MNIAELKVAIQTVAKWVMGNRTCQQEQQEIANGGEKLIAYSTNITWQVKDTVKNFSTTRA